MRGRNIVVILALAASCRAGSKSSSIAHPPRWDRASPSVRPRDGTVAARSIAKGASGRLEVLAEGQYDLRHLAVGSTDLLWTTRSNGAVMRMPLDGSRVTEFVCAGSTPSALAVDGAFVWWGDGGVGSGRTGSIKAGELSSGLLGQLAAGLGRPTALAVDPKTVYFADATGALGRVRRSGGKPTELATGQSSPTAIAVDDGHVYWTTVGRVVANDSGRGVVPNTGGVWRIDKTGGPVVRIAGSQPAPTTLALDLDHVYWTASGVVRRAPKRGGTTEELGFGPSDRRQGLALSDTDVFFSARGLIRAADTGAAVIRVPKHGGAAVVLARSERYTSGSGDAAASRDPCFDPAALAVVADALVVADAGCGQVLRMPLSVP